MLRAAADDDDDKDYCEIPRAIERDRKRERERERERIEKEKEGEICLVSFGSFPFSSEADNQTGQRDREED